MKKQTVWGLFLFTITLLSCSATLAQSLRANAPVVEEPGPTPIDISADRLDYESDESLLIGIGNVEVRHLGDYIRADYLEVKTDTQDVYAKGNVYLDQEGTEWEGEELRYNLKTKEGVSGFFKLYSDPYYITAQDSKRMDNGNVKLKDPTLTTCEGDRPIFYIRAKDAILVDGKRLKSRSIRLHFLGIPFFYVPYMSKNLEGSNFEFLPGYSSRQGAFLLTRYNHDFNETLNGALRLDVRTRRGIGVGTDLTWENPEETYSGEFNAYYLNDNKPLDDEEDEEAFGDLVDADRYRLRLQHRGNLSDRGYVVTDVNYLSDPLVLEDFFDREFRKGSQPENRLAYTHRDDYYTAGAELSLRLNDFYENVNRAPEFFLNVQRQQVYDTDFYYESQNSAGFYERVYPDGSTREDYDAFRADTKHTIYYPTRHFGFLNVIPRAGYRGTLYSETFDTSVVTNLVSMTDSNGVVTFTNEVEEVVTEEGAGLRSLFEIGVESSFKAFKELHNQPTVFGDGLRHVAEPFMKYTYIPDPSLERDELPQFDRVDRLGGANVLTLGMRNKLQTRNERKIRDLVDAEVQVDAFLDPDRGDPDYGPLEFDVEMKPFRWLEVEFDGEYLFDQENLIDEFNTEIRLLAEDRSSLSLEHRFSENRRDLLSVNGVLFPQDLWSFGAYVRYDNEEGELEEQQISVRRKGECLGWGLGVREVDDDITVWAEIWLTALPETMLDMGR